MTDIRMPSPVTFALGLILIVGGAIWYREWSAREREWRRSCNMRSNLRQITMALIAYTYDDEHQRYPPDLPFLVAYGDGELVPRLFKDPRNPSIVDPILYIRSAVLPDQIAATIPVLVTDPACRDDGGSLVAFADGHVDLIPGPALWAEAKRLAGTPKAATGGIEPADWTTLPKPPR